MVLKMKILSDDGEGDDIKMTMIADIYISISMGKRIQANQCGHTSKI